jgi:hypothetical protein
VLLAEAGEADLKGEGSQAELEVSAQYLPHCQNPKEILNLVTEKENCRKVGPLGTQ